MKYLLDTNIISELISIKPNQSVIDFLSSIDENDTYLSVITIGEIKAGIENVKSLDKKEKLAKWLYEELLKRFENRIIDIDVNVMITWAKISQNLKNIGKPLPIMDLLIASSCIYNEFVLVTRNEKDFKNLELKILNPFKISE